MTYGCSLRYMWLQALATQPMTSSQPTTRLPTTQPLSRTVAACVANGLQALAIHAPAIMPQLAEEETDSRISAISLLARREMTWR